MFDRPKRAPLAERPRNGDTVRMTQAPFREMLVTDTFYGNKNGGMHVRRWDGGHSWACCDYVEIIQRGPMWESGELHK
jgi:hypothetical protein